MVNRLESVEHQLETLGGELAALHATYHQLSRVNDLCRVRESVRRYLLSHKREMKPVAGSWWATLYVVDTLPENSESILRAHRSLRQVVLSEATGFYLSPKAL